MRNNYPRRAKENILPLSLSDKLPQAFREWFFTEEINDHEQSTADCQLCDKEELRYHFKIENENVTRETVVAAAELLAREEKQ